MRVVRLSAPLLQVADFGLSVVDATPGPTPRRRSRPPEESLLDDDGGSSVCISGGVFKASGDGSEICSLGLGAIAGGRSRFSTTTLTSIVAQRIPRPRRAPKGLCSKGAATAIRNRFCSLEFLAAVCSCVMDI